MAVKNFHPVFILIRIMMRIQVSLSDSTKRGIRRSEVLRWRIYAGTVGGDAIIVRKMPSGSVLVDV